MLLQPQNSYDDSATEQCVVIVKCSLAGELGSAQTHPKAVFLLYGALTGIAARMLHWQCLSCGLGSGAVVTVQWGTNLKDWICSSSGLDPYDINTFSLSQISDIMCLACLVWVHVNLCNWTSVQMGLSPADGHWAFSCGLPSMIASHTG